MTTSDEKAAEVTAEELVELRKFLDEQGRPLTRDDLRARWTEIEPVRLAAFALHLLDANERLAGALRRLSSMNAFGRPGMLTDGRFPDDELRMRTEFARQALKEHEK